MKNKDKKLEQFLSDTFLKSTTNSKVSNKENKSLEVKEQVKTSKK